MNKWLIPVFIILGGAMVWADDADRVDQPAESAQVSEADESDEAALADESDEAALADESDDAVLAAESDESADDVDASDRDDPRDVEQLADIDDAWLNQVMLEALAASTAQVQDDEAQKDEDTEEGPAEPARAQPRNATPPRSSSTESTELNLSGNDIMVETIGDTVIITGIDNDLDMLENLVKQLDEELPAKMLEIVILEKKDAKEVARQLQQAIDAMGKSRQKARPEEQVNLFPVGNNILLISAPDTRMPDVVSMAKVLDAAPERLPDKENMLFTVRFRKASEAATKLKEVIDSMRKVQGVPPGDKYDVLPNDANNTILVIGMETDERSKIQEILDAIDVEPVEGFGAIKLVLIPLLNVEAKTLAQVITDMLSTPQGRQQAAETIRQLTMVQLAPDGTPIESQPVNLEKPFRIIADEGTNSLVIATVDENIQPIKEIVQLLDDVPDAVEMGLQMFPLQFADAESVADMLTKFFKEGKNLTKRPKGGDSGAVGEGPVNEALAYEVNISSDPRTNIVFAAGRAEQMAVVKSLIKQIDVEANDLKFPLRLLFMGENLDATRAGQIVTELFEKRMDALKARKAGPAALERERVFLAVDPFANALIVAASDENYQEIGNICKQLDVAPDALIDSIRIITLKTTSAADLQTKIEELWQRKAQQMLDSGGRAAKDMPVIVADSRSNSLVIASSPEDFQAIEKLVQTLEKMELAPMDQIRMLSLQFNDAASVGDMIQRLFDERMKQRLSQGQEENPSDRVTITVDEATNTLLVASSQENFAEIERLVKSIDAERTEFRIYPLREASAVKLASKMQEMFDQRSSAGRGSATAINIQADEGSNSLIVSGSPDQQAQVASLLSLLDKESSIASQFQIFPLAKANAEAIAERLDSLFQAGKGGSGSTGRADVIAVEPDPRSNALIVWAAPTEMQNIAEIIRKLDQAQPTREMMVKLIRLKQALAEDFAKVFSETVLGSEGGQGGGAGQDEEAVILSFEKKNPDGTREVRKLVRQDIKITPDPYTNSLLVTAPAESMEMLESMIREFDSVQPLASEVRTIPLANADAEEMVSKLKDIFPSSGGGGGGGELERRIVFGEEDTGIAPDDSTVQELRFTADRRTNTVLASGNAVDLEMVERLIKALDSQDIEERINTVVKAGYRKAQDIAQAIEEFNQAESDRLSEVEDQMSAMRQAERAVTVIPVGDENSDSLIVGVSPRYAEQYMDMVYQLDRPEPQVMIQALIAEVTLNDTLDLGLEFAAQDLLFSEKAVLGPNGVIKGADFDFVGGTDLGTSNIGGGFSFATTGEDFNLLFRALQTNSKIEVLSRPTIMVRNNEEAEIVLGDRVPTISGTQINPQGSTSSTVEYNEVGIKLRVQPTINPDGYVTMQVEPEISAQTEGNIQLTEGLSAPIFRERSANTLVTIKDGETVVIGGLITDSRQEGETKVPIWGDIPVLGWLGGKSIGNTVSKTELLIVLTVDVMWSDQDLRDEAVEHRDQGQLPSWIKTSPLMDGLRIRPDEGAGMGPEELDPGYDEDAQDPENEPANDDAPDYGPRPGNYGPQAPTTVRVSHAVLPEVEIGIGYGPTPPEKIRLASARTVP